MTAKKPKSARDLDLFFAWCFRILTIITLGLASYVGKGAIDKLDALPEIQTSIAVLTEKFEGQKGLTGLSIKTLQREVADLKARFDQPTRR